MNLESPLRSPYSESAGFLINLIATRSRNEKVLCVSLAFGYTIRLQAEFQKDLSKYDQVSRIVPEDDSLLILLISLNDLQTGTIWAENSLNLELAEVAFSKATELCVKYGDEKRDQLQPAEVKEQQQLAFNIYISRARTALDLSQKALALNLLGRAKSALAALPERRLDLAAAYFDIGKSVLAINGEKSSTESIPYFQQAQELSSNAGASNGREDSVQESASVSELHPKILR